MKKEQKIAVLIPCYNEEQTIKKVVSSFKEQLPNADIYVYDNNSSDKTIKKAKKAGAIVRREKKQGKGAVMKRMFRDVEADIFVIVDGDDTYPAKSVYALINGIKDGADMVVGDRITDGQYVDENKRQFHSFGNSLVKTMINRFFHVKLKDIMSGYRAFSRDFVKNYPVLCDGFQIETDMTIFALDHQFIIEEIPIKYRDRPKGSNSKLRTVPDGIKVIFTIFNLHRHYRPLRFFAAISLIFLISGIIVGFPVISEYIKNTYINKIPSAILASGLIMLSVLFASIGVILDSVRRVGKEQFEMMRK
jgi:glycosyltransferase involved in cell wall biosynthesis